MTTYNKDSWVNLPDTSLIKKFAVEEGIAEALADLDLDSEDLTALQDQVNNISLATVQNTSSIVSLQNANSIIGPIVQANQLAITQLQSLITQIPTFTIERYDSLDDVTSPQSTVLYIIGTAAPYQQYVYIDNEWVLLGDFDVSFDGLATTDQLSTVQTFLQNQITQNTTDIGTNRTNISNIVTTLGPIQSDITSLTNSLTGLDTRVTTNTNNISTNASDIAKAVANISTNTGNIASNLSLIQALTSVVDGLQSGGSGPQYSRYVGNVVAQGNGVFLSGNITMFRYGYINFGSGLITNSGNTTSITGYTVNGNSIGNFAILSQSGTMGMSTNYLPQFANGLLNFACLFMLDPNLDPQEG